MREVGKGQTGVQENVFLPLMLDVFCLSFARTVCCYEAFVLLTVFTGVCERKATPFPVGVGLALTKFLGKR